MASKAIKEKKKQIQEDPYIKDSRYIALPNDVRVLFQRYLKLNPNGTLTDFISKRDKIAQGNLRKNKLIGGTPGIEFGEDGSINSVVLDKGKIRE